MEFCACNDIIQNTGTPSKQRVVSTGVKLIAVRMKADDGTTNAIASTDIIDEAYLDAKINEEDSSKRWYPLGIFKNEEDVRADSITETFSDGGSVITQQGVRTYLGWLINFAPKYKENLESLRCFSFGLFTVDSCGSLTGSISKDGQSLRPIRVNQNSWNPMYVKGTPTTSAKVQLTFEFSQIERDEYLRVISDDEMSANLLDAEGLLTLTGVISNISTTGFTIPINVDYDGFLDSSLTKVQGWILGDFKLFNDSTQLDIPITSVTESPEGTYTFVVPAQTVGDRITLTNLKTVGGKQGFSLSEKYTVI